MNPLPPLHPLQQAGCATLSNKLHCACERKKSKHQPNSNWSRVQIQIDQIGYAFYCMIQPTNNKMASLKDGFTILYQSQ